MRSTLAVRPLVTVAVLLAAAPLRAETLKVPQDFDTIQAAVDAAAAGDVIVVSKGVYDENVFIEHDSLTLKGKSATINGGYLGNCITLFGSDVSIEGFTLVNGGQLVLDGDPTGGLVASGNNVTLKKLSVRLCVEVGIALSGTGSITQCSISDCTDTGIRVETGAPAGTTVTTISKNVVERCEDGLELLDGPFLVEKNTCEGNVGRGIFLTIPDPGGTFVETDVMKNELRFNEDDGLEIDYQDSDGFLRIEKNVIESNSRGMALSGFAFSIVGNTIQDNRSGGIDLEASFSSLDKNKVRDNGAHGILVGHSVTGLGTPAEAGTNTLKDNTIQGNGGDGVHIGSSNNEVTDCTITDNAGDGIEVIALAADNVLHGDKVTDNGHDGIDNSGTQTTVSGDQCKGNIGADLAGAGDGDGTVNAAESTGNTVGDDSDLADFTTQGEIDFDP